MNRRKFIEKSGIGLVASLALATDLFANAESKYKGIPIGFQTFPIRDMLAKDFAGTLKTMANFGYKTTELCSPAGYAQIGFGFLGKLKTAEIKSIINDAGLTCPSCHFGSAEFSPEKIDKSIEFAQEMGLSQMVCSTFWLPKTAKLADYKTQAEKLNKAAEKIKSAGMLTGFHNHEMEFALLEGELIYDVLMKHFDLDLVKMQFQTEVIQLGYKASDYFKKYPGRFISAHLSDWTTDKKETAVGTGLIDWHEFFANTKTAGLKNIFVEMNFDKFENSIKNINKIKVKA
jgi:sugar phosphate isomerase/epimerase